MLQACRPAGRLFYWALAILAMAGLAAIARAEGPAEKPVKATATAATSRAANPSPSAASPTTQSGPALTSVIDTVFLADGTPAQGTLVITWPAFVTASGSAVAPGFLDVTLGTNGALNVQLIPNAGATPANTYFTVVYQLQPDEVRTEYWVVPTSSPATLAQVRTTPGSGTAAQPVSLQYVNTALAAKANDDAVVHLSGAESITGTKSFTVPPNVPAPVNTGDVANKSYVDTAVANVGVGNYLPTAGGTLTGPLTLSASPTAPLQAAPKQYVDLSAAGKADLVSGLVPTSELGSGSASSSNCLLGNGTWGACGSSANATEIQSVPVGSSAPSNGQVLTYSSSSGQYAPATPTGGAGGVSTSPAASQNIAQPAGTQFSTNNLANIRYVTPSWNWSYTDSGGILGNLTTAGSGLTITLTCTTSAPCPLGIDVASTLSGHYPVNSHYYVYAVYISGTGTPEAAPVTGGTCTPGATTGTCQLQLTTVNNHPNGYTVASASSGMQEAWNDAWVADSGTTANTTAAPYLKLASDTTYTIYSAVYLRGRGGVLDAKGAELNCFTRDRCIYVGTTQASPEVNHHKLYNLSMISAVSVDGVQVSSVSASAGTYTVTTASNHPFIAGDTVDCEYYSTTATQHWAAVVLSTGLTATHFEVSFGSASFSAGPTFGFCGLLNAAIEDNSDHVVVQDINIYYGSSSSDLFSFGIVNDNDQSLVIERASNRNDVSIRSDANFPMGAFIYERNDQGNNGITYVHGSEFTNVNCATGGGNGFVFSDSVCQGFPAYGVRYFGGLQPATFQNIYQESTGATSNPLYGSLSAQAGLIVSGGTGTKILGTFPLSGFSPVFATGGGTTAERTYFVAPRSSTLGYGPLLFIGSAEPASGSVSIPLVWPSVELQSSTGQSLGTLTWDILVTTGLAAAPPFSSGTYAVATNISGACGANGMCSFSDTQAAPASYTAAAQQFTPVFWFWPVSLAVNGTTVLADEIGTAMSAVASQGTMGVSIVADQCAPAGAGQQRSPIWIHCLASGNNGGSGSIATVLQQQDQANNGPATNSKGRLNFGKTIGNVPNDLVTLQDSNFSKTLATSGERPTNDPADMALGIDQSGGLSQRASSSISSYIAVIPTGSNYLERLTATAKTFNVPVTVNGNISINGQLLVAGPWMVSSPIPGTPMTAAGAGTSALGISNDGNFYISANAGSPQQVATTATSSYFSNLFQEDANDLGEYNGLTAQNLHVYSSYTNSSTWQRTSLGYDATDNYAVLRSESSGTAPGLGFWVNNGLKWVVDATSNLKPWTDQSYNVGSFNSAGSGSGLRPATVYVAGNSASGSGFELGKFASESYELCNDASTGTVINGLALLSAAGCAIKPSSALTSGAIGVVIATAGTTGVATLAKTGSAFCSFDGSATVIGDYVVPSSTTGSFYLCHDAGATRPTGVQILGRVLQASAGSATVQMFLDMPGSNVSSSAVGTGSCTNQAVTAVNSGAPTCSTITSAFVDSSIAPTASPALSGTPTAPTPATSDSSTKIATTAWVNAQAYGTGSGNVTGPGSSTIGDIATFSATNGKTIQDSGTAVSALALLASPALTGTPTAPTATAGDNSTKIATTAYIKNEAQFAWTCPVSGSTSVSQNCNWTIPAGLTITGFDLAANTAPAGCTTYAVMQLWDGTAAAEVGSYSITQTSGNNFYTQVTGSTNMAAGHLLRVKVTTAASGCSTNAASLVATVTYQMQN